MYNLTASLHLTGQFDTEEIIIPSVKVGIL